MSEEEFFSIVPLSNFESDVRIIQLNENLCLRILDESETKSLMRRIPELENDYRLKNLLAEAHFIIEKKWLDDEARHLDENAPYITDIILALRLLKPYYVTAPTVFSMNSKHTSFYISNPAPVDTLLDTPYFLKREEIDSFIKLWNELQRVKKEKQRLSFPLEQFIDAFEEIKPRYFIVNFMTAFESLVFQNANSPRNKGDAIGKHIGTLLGRDERERNKIKQDLQCAYQLRNYVVHGHLREKLTDYDNQETTELIFRVEDYLRRSLKKILEK